MFTALAALAVVLPGLIWLADKGVGISLPIPAEDVFALCSTVAAGLIWYGGQDGRQPGPESGRCRIGVRPGMTGTGVPAMTGTIATGTAGLSTRHGGYRPVRIGRSDRQR